MAFLLVAAAGQNPSTSVQKRSGRRVPPRTVLVHGRVGHGRCAASGCTTTDCRSPGVSGTVSALPHRVPTLTVPVHGVHFVFAPKCSGFGRPPPPVRTRCKNEVRAVYQHRQRQYTSGSGTDRARRARGATVCGGTRGGQARTVIVGPCSGSVSARPTVYRR